MSEFHTLKWSPISDLSDDWKSTLEIPETHALVSAWQEQAIELQDKKLFQSFLDRLRRQWAIETGVIEGLYDISEAGTKTLIEKGLDASLLAHDDTNHPGVDVVTRIKDQYNAIMGLYQFVSGERPLGTSYIKELHQVLTAHQDTYTAYDILGNIVERELPRGEWKKIPNNVEHSDGTQFEFCPPEHVDQEIELLIEMHHKHNEVGVSADIEAAWLHHRFTLIHPFTDGNGRIARCLATLVLLKDKWLPLVITRQDRNNYIDALRNADHGDLRPLVEIIGLLQRRAIREALSLSEDVITEAKQINSILDSVREKFENRRKVQVELQKRSLETADSLQHLAQERLRDVASEIQSVISSEDYSYRCRVDGALHDAENAFYFYHQTIQTAKTLGYFADRHRYQSWARLVVVTDHQTEILFSFHGIGHANSGILGCAAMLFTRDKADQNENGISETEPLSEEPFEFVYSEDPTNVQQRFSKWLDNCVFRGLRIWQKTV